MFNLRRVAMRAKRGLAFRQRAQRARLIARSVSTEKLTIVDVLELDHLRVHKYFREMWWARSEQQKISAYHKLRYELLVHSELEERVFYPVARDLSGLKDAITESYEEHAVFKTLTRELDDMIGAERAGSKLSNEQIRSFDAKADVLFENVDRHVLEEEREVFPMIRRQLGRAELIKLADQFGQQRAAVAAFVARSGTTAAA